jgi:CHAT domain
MATTMTYLDFDLAIEPSGDGYTARVFNSPGGQAAGDFKLPFSDLEIENFFLRLGRSRHAVRRIESPEMESAKAFGGQLFNGVFAGDVRGCLRSSLDEASRQGAGLRIRLHLSKVPALADLPWEFLYNPGMNRFLGLSVETPLVRYLDLPERIRPLVVTPPLRVLMMISSPSDYPQLDVERESAKMNEALADPIQRGLVTVERQEDATLSELQRRLRKGQYHIFHFVGHGGFDEQAQDGILVLEDQENRGRRVSAQFLGTLLHDHRPLRLAILNACEGGRASRADLFAGTAQSLVQQGIPAVIAMQFEVTDEAAICFTHEFYVAIAGGYPVDGALAEARKAIFAGVSEIEWGTPILYMRSPDGRIFEVEQVSEADRKQLQVSSLLKAARTAAASNDWSTAIDGFKQVLAMEPGHADAAAGLREATQQAKAADEEARRQQEIVERESSRAAAAARAQARAEAPMVRTEPHAGRPFRWFFIGGALSAAAIIVTLVIGAVGLIVLRAGFSQNVNRAHTPPAAQTQAGPAPASAFLAKVPDGVKPGESARRRRPDTANQAAAATVADEPVDETPTRAPVEPPALTDSVRAELVATIRRGDDAEIQAYRTLDPTPLNEVYSGEALAMALAALQVLAGTGMAAVNQLHDQEFESFSLSRDGRRAEVRLTETWSSTIYLTATQQCVAQLPRHKAPQTLFLERRGGGWIIYAAKDHGPEPVPGPCR